MRTTSLFLIPHADTDEGNAHRNLFFAADFLLHLYAAESRYNFLIDYYVIGRYLVLIQEKRHASNAFALPSGHYHHPPNAHDLCDPDDRRQLPPP